MTATLTEFAAADAGIAVASQEPSLTVGPGTVDRLLARGRIRGVLAMLGPAFVASVAYVDPGKPNRSAASPGVATVRGPVLRFLLRACRSVHQKGPR
jgi:hypothetical protein